MQGPQPRKRGEDDPLVLMVNWFSVQFSQYVRAQHAYVDARANEHEIVRSYKRADDDEVLKARARIAEAWHEYQQQLKQMKQRWKELKAVMSRYNTGKML